MVEFIQIVFGITALYILFSIFMTWTVTKTMQAAYWLILMLVGVAILFLLANSEILFAFQISIYGGGISVLLLFAALLTQHDDYLFAGDTLFGKIAGVGSQLFVFILLAINLIFLPVTAVMSSAYSSDEVTPTVLGDTKRTVEEAYGQTYGFVAELWAGYGPLIPFLAMLLLTALLGSVKLVIREWELEDLSDQLKERYNAPEISEVAK